MEPTREKLHLSHFVYISIRLRCSGDKLRHVLLMLPHTLFVIIIQIILNRYFLFYIFGFVPLAYCDIDKYLQTGVPSSYINRIIIRCVYKIKFISCINFRTTSTLFFTSFQVSINNCIKFGPMNYWRVREWIIIPIFVKISSNKIK